MMSDPLVARATDPETSHAGVKNSVQPKLKQMVWSAAVELGNFTDTELRDYLRTEYGKRVDRGVIARTRLNIERDGLLRRTSLTRNKCIVFSLSLDGRMVARGSGFR
jgi:hypothetical protein